MEPIRIWMAADVASWLTGRKTEIQERIHDRRMTTKKRGRETLIALTIQKEVVEKLVAKVMMEVW
jgi:hypothetical protein